MNNKRISVLISSLLLSLILTLSAAAQEALVIYRGYFGDFDFYPGSVYSSTDLFPEFKGVMPGDKLTQKVTFIHTGFSQHSVKVYMRALGASEGEEFLSKLTLSVDSGLGNLFNATAIETAGLTEWTYIATVDRGDTAELAVTLTVPTDLDNSFQYSYGSIDWQFKIEEFTKSYIPLTPSKKEEYIKYRVAANYYTDNILDNPVPLPLYNNERANQLPSIEEIIETYSLYTKYGDNEYEYTSLDFDARENAFTLNFSRVSTPVLPEEPHEPDTEYITYKIEAKYYTNGMLDSYIPIASIQRVNKPDVSEIAREYSEKYKNGYEYTDIEFNQEENAFILRYDRTDSEIKPDDPVLPTGDSTNVVLYLSLSLISLFALIVLFIILFKKKKDKK